jgi:hypothetical protein
MSTIKPRNADDLTLDELALAAIDMDRVLEREPQLSDFGFGVYDPRSKTPEERIADLRLNREYVRAPRSLAQFMAARGWLRQFRKIKASNRRGTSYGLKHCAQDDIGYVTNGVFIAAAIGAPEHMTQFLETGDGGSIHVNDITYSRDGYPFAILPDGDSRRLANVVEVLEKILATRARAAIAAEEARLAEVHQKATRLA